MFSKIIIVKCAYILISLEMIEKAKRRNGKELSNAILFFFNLD